MMKKKCKHIIMLTGESGCGKTTVRNKIKEIYDSAGRDNFFHVLERDYGIFLDHRFGIRFGYEYTTRNPRPEEEGKTPEECGYRFISDDDFEKIYESLGPDRDLIVRRYHNIDDNGMPVTWSFLFMPESDMFTDDDSEEICICASNIDAYLPIKDRIEFGTNFTCDAIHMVVPYETLLYRSINREFSKPEEKQNIKEAMRRFALEHNPDIPTKPFRMNVYALLRRWLGPSDYIYINSTHVIRLNGSIDDDYTMNDIDRIFKTIDTHVYERFGS